MGIADNTTNNNQQQPAAAPTASSAPPPSIDHIDEAPLQDALPRHPSQNGDLSAYPPLYPQPQYAMPPHPQQIINQQNMYHQPYPQQPQLYPQQQIYPPHPQQQQQQQPYPPYMFQQQQPPPYAPHPQQQQQQQQLQQQQQQQGYTPTAYVPPPQQQYVPPPQQQQQQQQQQQYVPPPANRPMPAYAAAAPPPAHSGYQQPDMLNYADPFVMHTLAISQRFNITTRWKRSVDITVHEAKDLVLRVKDGNTASCLVTVGEKSEETRLAKKSMTPSWQQQLSFKINTEAPPPIKLSLLNSNMVMAKDSLGDATVDVSTLSEGNKVNMWLPVVPSARAPDAKGEVNVTIGLTLPYPDNFKFVISHDVFTAANMNVKDADGQVVFELEGNYPADFHFKDKLGNKLINIKRRSLFAIEPSYDIYFAGNPRPVMEIIKEVSIGGPKFKVVGPSGVYRLEGAIWNWDFRFMDVGREIARVYGQSGTKNYIVEVSPDQEVPLFLACAMVVDKTTLSGRSFV